MINKSDYITLCEDAQQNIEMYKTIAEQQVTTWQYASWKLYDLTPYYFERNHMAKGKESEEEQTTAYGMDKDGEIWVTRCDELLDSFGYYSRSEDQLIKRIYCNGQLDSIEEITYENGLPARYVQFIVRHGNTEELAWHFEEYYEYEHNRVIQIKRDEYWEVGIRHYTYSLSYDNNGQLLEIVDANNDKVYVYLSDADSQKLRDRMKIDLIHETKKVIHNICERVGQEKICFLGVYLSGDIDTMCDPIFHPALERERQQFLLEQQDLYYIWSTGEYTISYQESMENTAVIQQSKVLMQHWEMQEVSWDETIKIWREVCVEINKEDWSSYASITEDFVMFVDEMDLEIEDLETLIPEKKAYLLIEQGLLQR